MPKIFLLTPLPLPASPPPLPPLPSLPPSHLPPPPLHPIPPSLVTNYHARWLPNYTTWWFQVNHYSNYLSSSHLSLYPFLSVYLSFGYLYRLLSWNISLDIFILISISLQLLATYVYVSPFVSITLILCLSLSPSLNHCVPLIISSFYLTLSSHIFISTYLNLH